MSSSKRLSTPLQGPTNWKSGKSKGLWAAAPISPPLPTQYLNARGMVRAFIGHLQSKWEKYRFFCSIRKVALACFRSAGLARGTVGLPASCLSAEDGKERRIAYDQ